MFGWGIWYINHCSLLIAKSSLYTCIEYIWFALVRFYGFINRCRLFKPFLSQYIRYVYDLLTDFVNNILQRTCALFCFPSVYSSQNSKSVIYLHSQFVLFDPYIGHYQGPTSPGQSGPGINGKKKWVLQIPKSSTVGASPSDVLMLYTGHWLGWGHTPLLKWILFIL